MCLASALDSEPVKQLRALLGAPAWLAGLQTMAGYITNDDAFQSFLGKQHAVDDPANV